MPNEGVTAWDDVVRGRVEFPNEKLEDVVLVRGDGRPTYNFASPMEDVWDGITHVIRGEDHISNTPKQINIIRAVGAEVPMYAHVPNVNGRDGKKLSKRHGATGVDEFRKAGYLPDALVNFLALLGWAPDGETTIMSRDVLVERFLIDRVTSSPAQFDYDKLDWMNGVYLRALSLDDYVHALVLYLGSRATAGRRARPQDGAARAGEDREARQYPAFAGFFEEVGPTRRSSRMHNRCCAQCGRFTGSSRSRPRRSRRALRAAADAGLARQAFSQSASPSPGRDPPGLFESIDSGRTDACAAQPRGRFVGSGRGGRGGQARWNCRQARCRNGAEGRKPYRPHVLLLPVCHLAYPFLVTINKRMWAILGTAGVARCASRNDLSCSSSTTRPPAAPLPGEPRARRLRRGRGGTLADAQARSSAARRLVLLDLHVGNDRGEVCSWLRET